jgi:hypothetical protein
MIPLATGAVRHRNALAELRLSTCIAAAGRCADTDV